LQAVELFQESQQANKKIHKYMGEHIDPIRIKQERIKYMKNKKIEEKSQRKRGSKKAPAIF
jgi:hypothetical protein